MRDFAPADRTPLAAIYDAASRHAFPWAHLPQTDELDFDRITEGEDILVAEASGGLTGFSSVWTEDSFLHHFYVHPSAHRKGTGRALMAATLARHGEALSLKCVERNLPARKFYRALGWVKTDEPGGADVPTGNWIWLRTPAAAAKLGLTARQDTE